MVEKAVNTNFAVYPNAYPDAGLIRYGGWNATMPDFCIPILLELARVQPIHLGETDLDEIARLSNSEHLAEPDIDIEAAPRPHGIVHPTRYFIDWMHNKGWEVFISVRESELTREIYVGLAANLKVRVFESKPEPIPDDEPLLADRIWPPRSFLPSLSRP